ncbi:polypeptide N-acetylgalactosaminyltransferase 5-like [Saccostrea echinata]|uniref:polypeptide N-acetylgalactosaminyltransferase 5-like n=1 Tax=Saccostrea echinata TaxID=191078 RepID=UPI002A7FC189|nr:polypeptide N-acetylgalactosaminyltransferase 5-like [Saccostrea echinata]
MARSIRTRLLAVIFLVSSVWLFVTLFLFDIESEINKTRTKDEYPNIAKFVRIVKRADDFMKLRDRYTKSYFNKTSWIKYQEKKKRREMLKKWKVELSLQKLDKKFTDNSFKSSESKPFQLKNSRLDTTANISKASSTTLSPKVLPNDSKQIKERDDTQEKVSRKVSERERLRHLEKILPPIAPGEYGHPVKLKKEELRPDQQKIYDELFKRNSFNQYASDMISYHRRLPDIRNPSCKLKTFPKDLPATSIIICFHNEAWSVLLRTVHSILNRTPLHLIHEIILVDDFSDLDFLKEELDDYFSEKGSGKVRVLRTNKREGLIRARLLGYEAATGEILTFLDSHIECFSGWLEPLLERIAENHTRVVAPIIDIISDQTFACGGSEIAAVGTFDISIMGYKWLTIPREEKEKHGQIMPWRTPTIAGGLFSINRDYFTKMGTYDHGMDIWGGENLEISFRIWMCGGSLEIHPCSHVAHIFRSVSPYKWGRSFAEILRKNAVRTAEVWMDEYKHVYYERINYDLGDYGDVSHRQELRRRLGCKSFGWYLQNMLPGMKLPEKALYSGEVRNLESGFCLDTMGTTANNKIHTIPCHGLGGNQFFRYTISGFIERDEACLTDKDGSIYYILCKQNVTKWEYTKDHEIRVQHTNSCLSLNNKLLNVLPCNNALNQKWTWTRKIEDPVIK